MMELKPDTASQLPVTQYEEQAWLLQQHYPEQVFKHFSAWRLAAGFDPARLERALGTVIAHLPALTARYRFDDEGELRKVPGGDGQACISVLRVCSEAQASERLLALQRQSWDAEHQAPLDMLLMHVGQDLILAFVLHQVLDQTCREDDLFRMVMDAYAGRPVGAPHLPWLQREVEQGNRCAAASAAPVASSAEGPGSAVAALILDEFRAALGEPGMTAADDFFDFGGHSLLATRIIGKLSATHGIDVQFNDFFSASSAAALAARARVRGQVATATTAMPAQVLHQAPFAPAQASLGRAYAAFEFGTLFNLPFALEFLDQVDEPVFEQALRDLVERHASLRTTFHFEDGEAFQRLVPVTELARYKWFWPSHDSQGATLASEATHRFDLAHELPLRVRFFHDPRRQRQTLSLLVHHMAIDEWSLNVMMGELAQAYLARAADKVPVWSAPAPSFHEYAVQAQAAGINPQHLAYWTDMLRDATRGLALPAAGPVSSLPAATASTQARWFEIKPGQAITDNLYSFARQNGSSLFGVVYTAIALALHKVGGLQELVIGTSASGRTDPAYYDTVGYFTTMVAHRVQFDRQQAVGALVEHVSSLINDSMAYADVPMEQIQQALGMPAEDGLLFDVYIQIHANNALNGALATPEAGRIRYRQIDPDKNQSMFGIQFEIMENLIDGQRSLRLVVTYRTDRYSPGQMARVAGAIEQVMALFASGDAASVKVEHVPA